MKFINIVNYFCDIRLEHDFLNATNISHNPTENTVYKYENHPGVIAIKKYMKSTNSSFCFQIVTKENIAKLITNLDIKKAVQSMDISTKLKSLASWFQLLLLPPLINALMKVITWMLFKKLKFDQVTKKMEEQKNRTIDPLVSLPMFQKFMKDACMIKFILIFIK